MSKIVDLKSKKAVDPKKQASKLKWSYRLSTIGLCGSLIFNSCRVFFTSAGWESSLKMSEELNVPDFLGLYAVPIGSIVAAIIILSNWRPTLRTFAYAWTLFYFVLELLLVINVKHTVLILWSINNLFTWAGAYYWNLKRIAKNQNGVNNA
jgi:hypothetical protein